VPAVSEEGVGGESFHHAAVSYKFILSLSVPSSPLYDFGCLIPCCGRIIFKSSSVLEGMLSNLPLRARASFLRIPLFSFPSAIIYHAYPRWVVGLLFAYYRDYSPRKERFASLNNWVTLRFFPLAPSSPTTSILRADFLFSPPSPQ